MISVVFIAIVQLLGELKQVNHVRFLDRTGVRAILQPLVVLALFSACGQTVASDLHVATAAADPASPSAAISPPASPGPWIRSNPGGGGWFMTIGAGPDGLILAASDLSGFYRSQDRGRTWDVIAAAQGLMTTHASGIGFHPTDPDILFLGTE